MVTLAMLLPWMRAALSAMPLRTLCAIFTAPSAPSAMMSPPKSPWPPMIEPPTVTAPPDSMPMVPGLTGPAADIVADLHEAGDAAEGAPALDAAAAEHRATDGEGGDAGVFADLVVGAQNLGDDDTPGGTGANADNVNFGDGHDTAIGAGDIHTRIASIVIGGIVAGTDAGGDHFGFVSQQIGSFKSPPTSPPRSPPRSPPPNEIKLSPTSSDVSIHEVEL